MVIAALLERQDPETETELQGFVTGFTDPVITILGVTIDSSNAEFRDENDLVLTRAEFFNRLSVNSLLSVEGTETAPTTIVAEEIEFEVED